MEKARELRGSRRAQLIELERCRRSVHYWFDNWAWTYDPRLASIDKSRGAFLPFELFPRQREMVDFILARIDAHEDGLIEKSRDIGFTWCAGGLALHHWIFVPGFKTAFGSRKAEYVDKRGDPDSIFEKIRMLYRALPRWMLPGGFSAREHDNYMRLKNPDNENVITGESGDDMGRGGRNSLYFLDEFAFVEHGDTVDAATSANSEVRIFGSTVNGMGNTFARKRHGGALRPDQIFRFHYSDDPRKTEEWAKKKKKSMESFIWASEYDVDYSASTEGIAIPAKWVQAAVSLGQRLQGVIQPSTTGIAGFDVGAGGKGKSVVIGRFGSVILKPTSWGDPDTTESAHRALDYCRATRWQRADGFDCTIKGLYFDAPGVGAGVLSTLSGHNERNLQSYGINTGVAPSETVWPDGETSEAKFTNLKAEIWWLMRARFKAAYEHLMFLEWQAAGGDKPEGAEEHSLSELCVLPTPEGEDSGELMALISQLSLVKFFRQESGKIIMESKKQLADRGIASPDYADALALTYARNDVLDEWENLF